METEIIKADLRVQGDYYADDGNPIRFVDRLINTSLQGLVYAYSLKAIIHGKNTRNLFDVTLMALESDEVTLCGGRFANYKHQFDAQDWDTAVDIEGILDGQFEGMVDWIASNLADKWSVSITPYHVSRLVMTFNFESYVDAMHFSLRWR